MKIVALGKKPMKKTGLLLAVIASIFFCFTEGRGEDWKEFAEATTGSSTTIRKVLNPSRRGYSGCGFIIQTSAKQAS